MPEHIESPDGTITVRVDPDGTIAVDRSERPIIDTVKFDPSPNGAFPDGYEYQGVHTRTVTEEYELIHGKHTNCRHEATCGEFEYSTDEGVVTVEIRVADDGVAFRYRYPEDGHRVRVFDQAEHYQFPRESISYLHPYSSNHETIGETVPLRTLTDGTEYQFPALCRTGQDDWALLCESGVDGDWAAGRLVASGTGFDIETPGIVQTTPPATSPWRVAIIGDLATIVESTLVTDLAGSSELEQPDWVEPGRAAWSWWSTGTGERDLWEQYVDYAAEHGWEHVLIDWNWDREQLPALLEYATERSVGVFVWSHYIDLNTPQKRAERFSRWAEWGVSGVKIDFMESDDQGRLQFYDAVTEAAAEYELMVNFHGSIVPTGMRRRWPNVMTYEGVYGAEHHPGIPSEHTTMLPFTRNVVGPMDYTPVTVSADSFQTLGHELALSVVFESGVQHLADDVETYADYPLAESFLDRLPPTWDETRLLAGKPGQSVVMARRAGSTWYLGGITAGPEQTFTLDIGAFGAEAAIDVIRDDPNADSLREESTAISGGSISVPVAENGGFVATIE
jgi:hypothetical protein